jgi:hypothetical protein
MLQRFPALALVAITVLPTAFALPGFYESFRDGNDVVGMAVAEPTAWFTNTGPNWGPLHGAWNMECSWTGQGFPACGSQHTAFAINPSIAGIDWTLTYSMKVQRATSGGTTGGNNQVATSGGTLRDLFTMQFTSATNLQVIRGQCMSGGTTNVPVTAATLTYSISVAVSYVHSTNTVTTQDSSGSCSFVSANFDVIQSIDFQTFNINALSSVDASRDYAEINDLVWNPAGNTGMYTLPATPRPPTGLSATVQEGWTGSESKVFLTWPLSLDDPDQVTGSLTYTIYANGVKIVDDPITSIDGGGHRSYLLTFGGTVPEGKAVYWIVATDRGLSSIPSCSVAVDDRQQGNSNTCGQGATVCFGCAGTGIGTTPADVGAGIVAFAQSIGFTSTGSLFFFGLILVAIGILAVGGAFAAVTKSLSPFPGAVGGIGMMLFNVFTGIWQPWAGVVLIILSAAAVIVVARRIFVGAGGGGSGG